MQIEQLCQNCKRLTIFLVFPQNNWFMFFVSFELSSVFLKKAFFGCLLASMKSKDFYFLFSLKLIKNSCETLIAVVHALFTIS